MKNETFTFFVSYIASSGGERPVVGTTAGGDDSYVRPSSSTCEPKTFGEGGGLEFPCFLGILSD